MLGWLRAAYLVAFATFGYRYIFRRDVQVVREQVTDTGSDLLTVFSMTMAAAPRNERRILLVESPEHLRSVCVQLGRHLIFLPGLSPTPDLYQILEERAGRHEANTLSGKLVPWRRVPTLVLDLGWQMPAAN